MSKIQSREVSELESIGADLIQVESTKEQTEAEVEKVRNRALKQALPTLKPLDKKEVLLKRKAIDFYKANENNRKLVPKGKKSISTRTITTGKKNGRKHVVSGRRSLSKEQQIELLADLKKANIAFIGGSPEKNVVQVIERVHLTNLKNALMAGDIPKSIIDKYALRTTQKKHYYAKPKRVKSDKPKSRKAKGGKK
jgi:hypothetical protein